ncbi:hypothetical protein E0L36_05400 [Streptomyces sp. AJS327]|uniref:hypothetical protein n=1 Tax=Streptomyces sp. AJS327 TaxID=2545265 RepID=UPI0015DE9444|nr:hypothetical protein [Streptomyces sp. AJS327]MBA0050351.1 hypothetical protein [Streptomyces sp. AJS327]
MDMGAAGIRTARAAVFAALCVLLSSGAHVLLSGAPVPLSTLLLVAAVIFAAAFALAGRERRFGAIAGLLIPLELAADTIFTSGQHACYGQGGGPVTGPLRSVGVDLLCGGGGLGTPLARVAAGREGEAGLSELPGLPGLPGGWTTDAAVTPWLLLAAHVLVGLLAALWLRRGEAALARLLRAAAATAFRPLQLAWLVLLARRAPSGAAPRKGAEPRALDAPAPPTPPLLTHSVHRRGPPLTLAS